MASLRPVVAISGGVGGAKLALGLQAVLPAGALSVAVNTGDDFEYLGLAISPDIDTVLYTLAGLADPDKGWGRAEESWNFMAEIERLGADSWFRLGDKDLAVHVERTRRLRQGETLASITERFARRLGMATRILPASNDQIRTLIDTDVGTLDFQEYFVHRRCAPVVSNITYRGAAQSKASVEVLEILSRPDLRAVVLCPSNPYLSLDPILAIPDFSAALRAVQAPVVAVSPLIGGQAIKGPTAKIMRELGLTVSSSTIATHFGDLLDGMVLDSGDAAEVATISVATHLATTLMQSLEQKCNLARQVLQFADSLRD